MAIGPDRSTVYTRDTTRVAIDEGLRSYMLRVYNYMSLGVAFTAAVTMIVAMNPAILMALADGGFWILFIGILGLGFFAPRIMMTRSVGAAQACFWVYAALWGVLMGPMIFAFANIPNGPMLIGQAFFITAGVFAGMSLLGYTTKKNLSGMGTFFMMAAIGFALAIVVNIFIGSTLFSLLISIGVVLVFAGLTAYETQQIKNMYYQTDGHDVVTRKAIFGAFLLYGAFVTMFIHILNILGIMNQE